MTRTQHEASRALARAEYNWLAAYGWTRQTPGSRVRHRSAPPECEAYSVRDAMALTRADPLRYQP